MPVRLQLNPVYTGDRSMDSSIRIIKLQTKEKSENSQPEKDGKTPRQNAGEIAMTIKGWIAERQQSRRTE
jgi:hypothetical protein